MHNKTAPVRLRFATLLMLSLATCGLVASPESQEKPSSSRVRQSATVQAVRPCQRDMPDLSRYGLDNVRTVLARYDLSLGEVISQPHSAPKGTIVGQSWKPGSPVKCGTPISITVSTGRRSGGEIRVPPDPVGPVRCSVPDLTNQMLDDVQAPLRKRKWSIGKVHPQESPARPGTILKQSPQPGVHEKCDWSIDVAVAVPITVQPPPPPQIVYCRVPDTRDGDLDAARRTLAERNLQLGKVVRESSERTVGTVLGQQPGPNATAACGSTVDVRISDGPAPRPIPDLLRLDRRTATDLLVKDGFRLGEVFDRQFAAAPGTIVDQQPRVGTLAPVDTVVQVWVAVPVPPPPAPPAPTPPPTPSPEAPAPQTPTTPPIAPPTPGGSADPTDVVPEQRATPIVPTAPAAPEVVVPAPPAAPAPEIPTANTPVAPVLAEIPNVVGRSATQAADLLRAAGFAGSTLSTAPSPVAAGTVTSQRPEAGRRAAPGTQVELVIAVPVSEEAGMPLWWLLLGVIGGAAAAGVIAKVRARTPRALPPSVRFEPHPDGDVTVTLSADGALIHSELWLEPCPDAGVQMAGPFGMSEVTESR